MRHRLIVVGIVGFWAVMMATLVRRWILEVRPESVPGTYRSVLTPERRNLQRRMGIYLPDGEGLRRVGFTETVYDYRDGQPYKIDNVTRVNVPVPGIMAAPTAFDLTSTTLVTRDHQLKEVWIHLDSPLAKAECRGRVVDGKLVFHTTVDGEPQEPYEMPMPPGDVVAQGLSPLLSLPPLSEGMRWSATVIDPMTFLPKTVELEVVGREKLEWEGEEWETHVVEIRSGLVKAQAWISRDGDVLKERTLFGVTFIKERVPEDEPKE